MKLSLDSNELATLADLVAERLAGLLSADRPSTPKCNKLFLTEREAADVLGISAWTLKRARLAGHVSSALVGRMVRYDQQNIDAAAKWLRERG